MRIKSIALIMLGASLLFGISGCGRNDQKTYAGVSSDELGLDYTLILKFNSELDSQWILRIKPQDAERFSSLLKQKWIDEKKVKFDAYENVKKYCELTKEKSACDSLAVMEKELSLQSATLTYTVDLLDVNNTVVERLSLNQPYDLGTLKKSPETSLETKSNFKIGRKNFSNIHRVTVKVKM